MDLGLTPEQIKSRKRFSDFVDEYIAPVADQNDRDEETPIELIKELGEQGFLGAFIPEEYGGRGMDMVTAGLLCEEIGRGSASLLSLLTINGMVSQAILKWGTRAQKEHWLPGLATAEKVAAFGVTEPDIGSDAKSVETTAELSGNSYILNGRKKWISYGQVADLFLILAQCDGKPTTFLIERDTPGFSTTPITGLLGFRSAMLAEVQIEGCRVPEENLVGRPGFGFSHVTNVALDHGRYCVGWGCLGLAEACLQASLSYTSERKQFGTNLRGHQLIQEMIADMITNIKATRLLCYHAAYLKETGDPGMIMETSIMKYFASRMVNKIANDAVQIHGAHGCGSEYSVQRYLRDAKIMEIIEGSNQMQQIIIAKSGYMNFRLEKRKK